VGEGPLGSKGSWIVSARRSLWDAFTNDLGFGGVPVYTNFQSKLVYDLNASNRLWLSTIGGRDSTSVRPRADRKAQEADPYNADSSGWRNSAGLNWQQLFGARGVGLLGLSYSRVTVDDLVKDIRLNNATIYRARSFDQEFTAKYDLTLELPALRRLQTGIAVRGLLPNYRIEAPLGSENPFSPDVARVNPIYLSQRATLRQQSAYAQFSRALTKHLDITVGARTDRYRYLDSTRISPRIGLTYRLTDNLSAHASAGAYSQQPAFTYISVLPVNRGLVPMRSTHFVAGLTWVPTPSVRATIEGYEKRYADYPVALDYPQITLASTPYMWGAGYLMTSLTSAGRGRARGLELSIEKKLTRHFHVQANLTVSSSRHAALDQIMRPGGYDSRCISNLIGGYRFNDRWSLAIRYTEVTGRPYTPFDLTRSTAQNRGVFDLRRVNALRAPDYKRLDLRIDRNIQFHGGLLNVYVGIQNAFNRKNFYAEVWNFRTNSPKTENQLGAFPMIGLEWRFR
jgi:hypothetical protein